MLLPFSIGICIALIGAFSIEYLSASFLANYGVYVTAFVVFWIATILIFFETIDGWGEFVPATFLGTVLVFASGVTFTSMLSELFVPLLIGIFAGFITIFSREKLSLFLNRITMKNI